MVTIQKKSAAQLVLETLRTYFRKDSVQVGVRQRGLQVCFVQRAFLASQTKPYVKRTSNAACMMARWHKKFMTSSDAQVQTHRQTSIAESNLIVGLFLISDRSTADS